MMATDKDALECDFAETYNIYDMTALPITKIARLAVGLRSNSRVKMAMTGDAIDINTALLAGCYDILAWLRWAQTEDGANNRNHPKSMLSHLLGDEEESHSGKNILFNSAEEFERAFREME